MTCLSGCTRAYYRKQADAEVNCIVDHKAEAVGAAAGEFRIDVDPRSRMFDPDDPDCPPMPPDDPISHQLMNCVDCKPGAPCWKHAPHTPYADNPNWEEYLAAQRRRTGGARSRRARCRWRCCNRPTTSSSLKRCTCPVLDVTFERFRFDTQFFGGHRACSSRRKARIAPACRAGRTSSALTPLDFEARQADDHRRRTGGWARQLACLAILGRQTKLKRRRCSTFPWSSRCCGWAGEHA